MKNRPWQQALDRAVPQVVDVTGETVQQNFEDFLEEYVFTFGETKDWIAD